MIVLKGHLLIEEQLWELARREAKHPEALAHGRFSFYQISVIAKALAYTEDLDWMWSRIDTLNQVRNRMAHNLEPRDLERLLKKTLLPTEQGSESFAKQDIPARLQE